MQLVLILNEVIVFLFSPSYILTACSPLQVHWCVSGSQSEAAVQHPAAPQDHQHVAVASRPQLSTRAALPLGLGLQQCYRLRARSPLHHWWEETSSTHCIVQSVQGIPLQTLHYLQECIFWVFQQKIVSLAEWLQILGGGVWLTQRIGFN